MKWVTHDQLHLDRVASAWLILRFIDREAHIAFLPRGEEARIVPGQIPFGIPGIGVGSHDEGTTVFQRLVRLAALDDDCELMVLGRAVSAGVCRALNLPDPAGVSDIEAQLGSALNRIGSGMNHLFGDASNLATSLSLYDALYVDLQAEAASAHHYAELADLSWIDRRQRVKQLLPGLSGRARPGSLESVLVGLDLMSRGSHG